MKITMLLLWSPIAVVITRNAIRKHMSQVSRFNFMKSMRDIENDSYVRADIMF